MSHDTLIPASQATTAAIPDPGLGEHVERFTDADPAAGNRVYRSILFKFALVPVLAIAFVVVYFAMDKTAWVEVLGTRFLLQHLLLGVTLGLAILLIGIGAVEWARYIMNDEEVAEERHTLATSPADREVLSKKFAAGVADSGVKRRPLLLSAALGGVGILAVPVVVSLADLGPWPTDATRKKTLEKTIWAPGVRLVNDINKLPIKPGDLEVGQLVNAEPATLFDLAGADQQVARAKAAIIVVKMDPDTIKIPDSRKDWQVGGVLSYSKICTHVGCPISLWEQTTHHLLCPCHQSTFDLGNSGVVVFGPAARSLPQLPIAVDSEGYLVARSDFTVPVGPSYFERDSTKDYQDGDK
ncbi:MAG: Rieske 2Fe-2S domain-containing protein [Propionibacteriaceae bacterium]|nr:Rieske (2Fe-2S) protein [Micropruina sp.]HBX80329.1 ubiquinol-cytochrome C reductase [Propionibacteriaceae bacterium]HBY22484.1 ubiquinol-cytochrome C reductase [Propionibacteriaceae bacterium]